MDMNTKTHDWSVDTQKNAKIITKNKNITYVITNIIKDKWKQ